jgi:hypothetical protein
VEQPPRRTTTTQTSPSSLERSRPARVARAEASAAATGDGGAVTTMATLARDAARAGIARCRPGRRSQRCCLGVERGASPRSLTRLVALGLTGRRWSSAMAAGHLLRQAVGAAHTSGVPGARTRDAAQRRVSPACRRQREASARRDFGHDVRAPGTSFGRRQDPGCLPPTRGAGTTDVWTRLQ